MDVVGVWGLGGDRYDLYCRSFAVSGPIDRGAPSCCPTFELRCMTASDALSDGACELFGRTVWPRTPGMARCSSDGVAVPKTAYLVYAFANKDVGGASFSRMYLLKMYS